jgi:hypothetical protein
MKVVNREARTIDYRLNLLGIRVSKDTAQLIARWRGDEWSTIGAQRELPIRFPFTPSELNGVAGDTLRLTAYQYDAERPGSDLRAVLALEKEFEAATEAGMAAGLTPA